MSQAIQVVLLDASCLLNLYATGRLRDMASAAPNQYGVASFVLEREALYIRVLDSNADREESEAIDLSLLVKEGVIEVFYLTGDEEQSTFVDLASQVDDGEAITGSIAIHRGHSVATDDHKARRVLSERDPALPLVSTLALLSEWAQGTNASNSELRESMEAMRSRSSYIPNRGDPLYEWWREIMDG